MSVLRVVNDLQVRNRSFLFNRSQVRIISNPLIHHPEVIYHLTNLTPSSSYYSVGRMNRPQAPFPANHTPAINFCLCFFPASSNLYYHRMTHVKVSHTVIYFVCLSSSMFPIILCMQDQTAKAAATDYNFNYWLQCYSFQMNTFAYLAHNHNMHFIDILVQVEYYTPHTNIHIHIIIVGDYVVVALSRQNERLEITLKFESVCHVMIR